MSGQQFHSSNFRIKTRGHIKTIRLNQDASSIIIEILALSSGETDSN